jgi:hypothetical protein|tara:strand:+ start:666 stop:941 length:276 start_codon:yes stop_codon:yes gene_type:complete
MEREMLKFEKTAEIGDLIKAYDFQPMSDRGDSYIVGKVTDKGMANGMYMAYTVDVIHRVISGENADRDEANTSFVPFQVSFMEYDERVSKI